MKVNEIIAESNMVDGKDWAAKLPEGKDPVAIMKKYGINEFINQLFMADPVIRKCYTSGITMGNKKNKLSTMFHYYKSKIPTKAEFNSFEKKVEQKLEGTGFTIEYLGKAKEKHDPKGTGADLKIDYELIVKKV
jgi:hypothetical protein